MSDVALSCRNPEHQDLIWELAQRWRKGGDAAQAAGLEAMLTDHGYVPPVETTCTLCREPFLGEGPRCPPCAALKNEPPFKAFCAALRTWADRIQEGVDRADPNDKTKRPQGYTYADTLRHALRDITKSNLLYRLIYLGETLRTEPCPVHQGKWSGIGSCAHGCDETGWVRNAGEDAFALLLRALSGPSLTPHQLQQLCAAVLKGYRNPECPSRERLGDFILNPVVPTSTRVYLLRIMAEENLVVPPPLARQLATLILWPPSLQIRQAVAAAMWAGGEAGRTALTQTTAILSAQVRFQILHSIPPGGPRVQTETSTT